MFFWMDDVLADRVVERLGAGVEVCDVWDALGAANVLSVDKALCDAGARIKIEDFVGKVHHKFAVIDVESSDPVVIPGSYNWTNSGAYDNDENTLVIHDRNLGGLITPNGNGFGRHWGWMVGHNRAKRPVL